MPLESIIDRLETNGYRGWYVVETDVAITGDEPAPGEGPVRGVARSLDHLREIDTRLAASTTEAGGPS